MSILRTDIITLHRVDTGNAIYVKAAAIILIENTEAPSSNSLVYIADIDLVRTVKECPKTVRDMVEKALS